MMIRNLLRPAVLALAIVLPAAGLSRAHEYEGKAVVAAHPWARATPGSSTIGAAYVELTGVTGGAGDKLIGASSPVAGRIEIHTHQMDNDVMKMRKVEAVTIAAGEVRKLAPGGDHLMLFDLKAPLKKGEIFPLTLKFETSGEITVDAVIEPAGAMAPHQMDTDSTAGEGSDTGSDSGSHDGH